MLTFTTPVSTPLCDGLSRRETLRLGALGLGGITLPQLLAAEARAESPARTKAVIMIYLVGAPPHQDMFDLKMEAPAEIRGEFHPIATSVPGTEICEHLPRLAGIMDKLIPIRTMYGSPNGSHDSFICYTGKSFVAQPPGGWPSLGSVVSKFQGSAHPAVPPFVGLAPPAGHPPYGSPGHPGMLGVSHSAFRPTGPGMNDLSLGEFPLSRLADRRELLKHLDAYKRQADQTGLMAGMDAFTRQAFGLLTSSQVLDSLDLSKEDPAVRERYGKGHPQNYGDGAPRNLEHFLLARRLVEAGVRVVTLNFGRWDFHSDNFNEAKKTHLPLFDQGLSALVADLHERGLADDVAVVAWGEFGRTPRINPDAGRDHWTDVGCGVLAGGGFRAGQIIGQTDRLGGTITQRPVHFGEVFASLYRHLGFDPHAAILTDLAGRPQALVEGQYAPLPELM